MGFIGGALGIRILTLLSPDGDNPNLDGSVYRNRSKLEVLFGAGFFEEIRGKSVIDFGCGVGDESIEMVHRGAARVIGLDIRQKFLEQARERAKAAGVLDRASFMTVTDERADVIVSLDCFEHYEDPAGVLKTMAKSLKPNGKVIVSFGTTWYHPYGGHLFALFPWAHLLFTEHAMLAWRKQSHPQQTARTIKECGLNKMTIRRFEQLVNRSPLAFSRYETRPIRRVRPLCNRLTREFTTSLIQATLVPRTDDVAALRSSPANAAA